MENKNSFTQFLDDLAVADLQTNETASGKITIKQSQRNALRKQAIQAFYDFLMEQGINAYLTSDGVVIAVEHDLLGTISIENKLTFKALNYDVEEAADQYERELEDKAKSSKKVKSE